MADQNWWDAAPVVGGGTKPSGPVYGAPPKPTEPKTSWRTLSPDEAKANNLPADKQYQISSEGKIDALPTTDTKATVDQQKIATLVTRIAGGFHDIQGAVQQDKSAEEPGLIESMRETRLDPGGITGPAVRAIAGSNRRIVYDAQVDVLDALLTLGTGAAYNKEQLAGQTTSYFPQYGDTDAEKAVKKQRMLRLIESAKANAGPAWAKVEPAIAPYMQDLEQGDQNSDKAPPVAPLPGGNLPDGPNRGGGDKPLVPATGDYRRTNDPAMSAELSQWIRQGVPVSEINSQLVAKGFSPIPEADYAAWRAYLEKDPNYQGDIGSALKVEPISGFDKTVTMFGNNPVGAYFVNTGQFLSGNTLDNLTSDPARARASINVISNENPKAATLGQISGGVIGGMLGEAGLARAGMAAGMGRSAVADMAMNGAAGAGAADDGDRLKGGLLGAAAGGAGSVGGTLIARGLGKVVSPSGGSLADLYASGVRPTIGQRATAWGGGKGFSGVVGKAVNGTEEALQSVPLVGAAIRGAREEARDQFQVGAFNQALGEIGDKLPEGVGPGTAAHGYAQKAFNDVYDQARAGMTMVSDANLGQDIKALAPDIATLGEQNQKRLQAILKNKVLNRMPNGVLDGEAYKKVMSDLGRESAKLKRDPGSMDLADVIDGLQGAFDAAARRHSSPDAVKLLDAADAGYAKLVRIENAAARRGGEAGTFSPAQFDAGVQQASGGVRSKAYLRGDANMQDYATAGRALEDKLPNSGTADRALTVGGLAATGGAVMRPELAVILGAIGTAYAPGVRKVTKGMMAPGGPRAQAIAARLKKIEAIAAATGSASAAVGALGTSPSP